MKDNAYRQDIATRTPVTRMEIITIANTVNKLQELLNVIECELQALDLTINSKKIWLFTYRFSMRHKLLHHY